MTRYFAAVAIVLAATVAQAEEKAATSALPAALQALGGEVEVVSAGDAHQVRGQTGGSIWQDKSFSVSNGTAVGTTNLLEGVFGAFTFTQIGDDMSTLVVEGSFGGLSGNINASADGGLTFEFGGKALQESLDFTGKFNQDFSQSYHNYLP